MTGPRSELAILLGCKVAVASKNRRGTARCGLPIVAHGLCAKHEADRIRLGSRP